jgi:sulfite exporter TauE/SafE
MRHAMDPDHVIAVATIVTRERSPWSAGLIGGLWGLGHTFTIALVGGAIIAFDVVIPPRLGLAMEFSVALMLVLLGSVSLMGLRRRVAHSHSHDGHAHDHLDGQWADGQWADGQWANGHRAKNGHWPNGRCADGRRPDGPGRLDQAKAGSRLDRPLGRLDASQILRPIVVGLVHGLAGSAAVALLVVATIHDPVWAIGYLVLFGVGTIAGMMVMTATIGLPFAYTAGRLVRVHRYLGLAAGLLSIGSGLFLSYQIGLEDGLFTGNPQWSPR